MNLKQKIDKKEYLKIEIPVELENDYYNNLKCNSEDTLSPEEKIQAKLDSITLKLSLTSSIIFIDIKKLLRTENENYLGVIIFTGRFDSSVIIEMENLAPGLDNLMLWEYNCIKKYSSGEYAYQQYRIDLMNVAFEKDLNFKKTKKKQNEKNEK